MCTLRSSSQGEMRPPVASVCVCACVRVAEEAMRAGPCDERTGLRRHLAPTATSPSPRPRTLTARQRELLEEFAAEESCQAEAGTARQSGFLRETLDRIRKFWASR